MTKTQRLCEEWRPYVAEFKAAIEPYRAARGQTRSIAWQPFFEKHPQLAQRLGIKPEDVRRELSQSLSYFYGYHVTGTRKERDVARRRERQEQRASTPEQRAAWRAQKQESNARLAAGIRRQKVRTKIEPIVARREDFDLPTVEATNGTGGLRSSLLRTIEQLQALLKAIE